jgi:hypothetical protein
MTGTANPLIAARHDSTQWFTGIYIAEDIAGVVSGVQSGSWIDGTIGGVGTAMDTLGAITDPLGTLVSWGVGWLMEHVKPLHDALDHLAGDPDQITAYAQTWHNVADNAKHAGTGLSDAYWQQVGNWTGPAGEAYQSHAANHVSALNSIANASSGIGLIVEGAGLLVALVRGIVRDLIADFVSTLAVRLPEWLAEIGFTLGIGTPWVISQVASLVGKWVSRITHFLHALINSFRKLKPMLHKLGDLIEELRALLRKLGKHDPLDPSGPRAPDLNGNGVPDSLEPHGTAGGHADVPPAITDGPTLSTKDMNGHYKYETDPNHPKNQFAPNAVQRLTDAQREEHRVFVGQDGLLYKSDGTLFDTRGSDTHWGHVSGDDNRAIFVMDEHGNMYASTYQKAGDFHHSTLSNGQPVAGAGEIQVHDGKLVDITDQSGHYRPSQSMTNQVTSTLQGQGANMDGVKTYMTSREP